MEVLRSGWPFSGMPWGRLAFAVVDTPVAAALAYVGATGVSLLLALVGPLLAALVLAATPAGSPSALVARSLTAAAVLLVPALRPWTSSPDGTAAGRGGAGRRARRRHRRARRLPPGHRQPRPGHRASSADDVDAGRAERPDFVLWPENSTAVDPFADPQTRTGIQTAVGRDRRADPGRGHRRRRSRPRAQPGHRVGPGARRRRPLHQAPPGAVRRVHPVAQRLRRQLRQARHDPARHASAAPARSRCASAAPWSPTRSASTSPTTTGSTTRSTTAPRWSSCRRATRCSSTPPRSSSSSRSPGVRAIEIGRSVAIASINGRTAIIAPGRQRRWPRAAAADHEPSWTADVAPRRPRSPPAPGSGTGSGRLSGPVDGSGRGRRAARLSSAPRHARPRWRARRDQPRPSRAPAADEQEPPREPTHEPGRPRPHRHGGPDLQRGRQPRVDRGPAARRPARRRRPRRRRRVARRHRPDRRRARRRRPAGQGRAPHREGRPRRGVPGRLPGRPRRGLRRDRRDGRRRLPPARAAAPAARRARGPPTW